MRRLNPKLTSKSGDFSRSVVAPSWAESSTLGHGGSVWSAGVIGEESVSMIEVVASAAVRQVFEKDMPELRGW